jgi:hypothetical protein
MKGIQRNKIITIHKTSAVNYIPVLVKQITFHHRTHVTMKMGGNLQRYRQNRVCEQYGPPHRRGRNCMMHEGMRD